MATIVAFGNPVYDFIQTPYITTGERVLSGCSTNGCLALLRLGHTTMLVGCVGLDYRDRLSHDCARYGIALQTALCEQTGGFQLIYDPRGDRTLDVLGVAAPIRIIPDMIAQADAIIIGPIMQETPLALIRQIRQLSPAPLFLDPQGLLRLIGPDSRIEHIANPDLPAIAPLCEVIKANEVEARVITGIDPRQHGHAAARALYALGCRLAIVTLAEAGSIICDGRRCIDIPAYATEARDPTGAGDTYMAGFIHAYLEQPDDLYRAGCTGSATASIWIEYTGPDAPISLPEVLARRATLLPPV